MADGQQTHTDDDDTPCRRGWSVGRGGLTALVFAAREGDIESAKALVTAGADQSDDRVRVDGHC